MTKTAEDPKAVEPDQQASALEDPASNTQP